MREREREREKGKERERVNGSLDKKKTSKCKEIFCYITKFPQEIHTMSHDSYSMTVK